jgi:hypothetical protein
MRKETKGDEGVGSAKGDVSPFLNGNMSKKGIRKDTRVVGVVSERRRRETVGGGSPNET